MAKPRAAPFGLFALLFFPFLAHPGDYYSDNLMEPDKIGTAWLIKRYVDTSAVFHFVPKDSTKDNAIPFDLPNSKYRRYPRMSASMSVIKFHNIKDPKAKQFALLMDEMLLDEMLAEEAMHAKKSESHDEEMMDGDDEEMMEGDHDEAMSHEHEMMADPMGVMDVESDEMMVLAKLFNDRAAADEKEEEAEEKAAETIQEEVEEKAEEKEESKKASLRPQPKKASTGATRLGGVSKEAASEVNDLSKLWESAPDVSKFF